MYMFLLLFSLEYALRKFTALTQGDTILIHHGINNHALYVKSVQPVKFQPPAVCVLDTSVSVEFEAAVEQEPESESVREMRVEEIQRGIIPANAHHYYRVKSTASMLALSIEATAVSGDPCLFVSTKVEKVSNCVSISHCTVHTIQHLYSCIVLFVVPTSCVPFR